jgi:S-adenosylmethionine synthetase
MKSGSYLFTSESVTEGHPDKIADQISDAILDEIIAKDKAARVACETIVKTGFCMVAGEVTTEAYVEIPEIVRRTIKEIGYNDSSMGFDWETCGVLSAISQQSADIAMGVDEGAGLFAEMGAGDQGMMFGYACDETPQLMPAPIYWAHRLTQGLAKARKDQRLKFLRPDGKSQVTVEYENGKPKRFDCVLISTQHTPEATHEQVTAGVRDEIIHKILPKEMLDSKTRIFVNPTGRFVIGGPFGDCGLTGRKIIVDTYGGRGRHGGGAFSGKDPSKVDRSAAYMARYVAKNVVKAGLARECEVQIAYAIGIAEPLAVYVDTFGTGKVDENKLALAIRATFPLKPKAMIEHLNLLRPIYRKTAAYGHFGREEENFTWEKTDLVEKLKSNCS